MADAVALSGGDMVQPYVSSVADHGELSLMFFDRELSHAVRKMPRPGDYRVQEEYGGTNVATLPAAAEAAFAREVLERVDGRLLYARVDLVHAADGACMLSELELIEPSLYLRCHPPAAQRLAGCIARSM